MKYLILAICFMAIQFPVFADDTQEFANALGWEKKWTRIVSRSAEKYLTHLETGPFAKLSATDKRSAIDEIRQSLNAKLGWEVMGNDFSQGITKYCDRKTLETMTRYYNREMVLEFERKKAAKEYSICARKGFSESMGLLKDVIIDSRAQVDSIMRKHQ